VKLDRGFGVSLASQSVVAKPNARKMDAEFETPLGQQVDTPAFLPAETLNIYAERTCNFEKVVVRKVERKFEFTSLRHLVFLL
jgi:hypothetical protein